MPNENASLSVTRNASVAEAVRVIKSAGRANWIAVSEMEKAPNSEP